MLYRAVLLVSPALVAGFSSTPQDDLAGRAVYVLAGSRTVICPKDTVCKNEAFSQGKRKGYCGKFQGQDPEFCYWKPGHAAQCDYLKRACAAGGGGPTSKSCETYLQKVDQVWCPDTQGQVSGDKFCTEKLGGLTEVETCNGLPKEAYKGKTKEKRPPTCEKSYVSFPHEEGDLTSTTYQQCVWEERGLLGLRSTCVKSTEQTKRTLITRFFGGGTYDKVHFCADTCTSLTPDRELLDEGHRCNTAPDGQSWTDEARLSRCMDPEYCNKQMFDIDLPASGLTRFPCEYNFERADFVDCPCLPKDGVGCSNTDAQCCRVEDARFFDALEWLLPKGNYVCQDCDDVIG